MQQRLRELYEGITGIEVVGIAPTLESARRLVASTKPAIISLDLQLEDGSSLELIPFFRETCPDSVIIVVTQQVDPFLRKKVTKSGVAHFVDKAEVFALLPAIVGEYLPSPNGPKEPRA